MMTEDEEVQAVELATEVQTARDDLLSLLTREEGRTKRRTQGGSGYPLTFEDTALQISLSDDERAPRMAIALGTYQGALNKLWKHALGTTLPVDLTRMWARSRSDPVKKVGANLSDAESEVKWLLRELLARFRPDKGSIRQYTNISTFRALDSWLARQSLPMEIPTHESRKGADALAESREAEWEERRHHDDHIEDHMLDALDRAADGILNDEEME